MPKSDLPFGSEFSPSQVKLPQLLDFAKKYSGDWKALENAVYSTYFKNNKTSEYNKRKLANNTKLGMIAYGLIDRDANLTELGTKLFAVRKDQNSLYQELGRHILLNLHGATLVQCVQDMQAGGETVDLLKLRTWLEERGITFPRGGKHPSIMRLWLEKARVFTDGWIVDEHKLQFLMGATAKELEALMQLDTAQRAFLKTLANMDGGRSYPSNEIEKLASATYGVKFNEKNLPKSVLYPLEETNFIKLERGTKAPGRGAKPFLVTPTQKLSKEIILPLLQQIEKQVHPELRPLLRKSFGAVVQDLTTSSKHTRGLALEALAIKLMRLIDLTYVATRLRGAATGGAEVDVIFESTRLVFSRWQVQCKNTRYVSLDDVAKEVGLTHFLKSNVIVVVTTGQISSEARKYANKVMTDSNLCVVTIDQNDVLKIKENPATIVEILGRESKHAMKIKKLVL